jgi:hypothetical protein
MAYLGPFHRPRFSNCTRGSVAVQAALLMLLVLAFIALGVEVSQLLLEHRMEQTVADSAAMAAASAVKLGVTDLQAEARAVAAQQGYRNGAGGVTVTAANPPASGPHTGDAKYVEVRISRVVTPGLIQLFRPGAITVSARAVASIGASGSTVCALLLEPTASMALKMDGANPNLNLPNCAINVNSTSNSAVWMSNASKIIGDVNVAGNVLNQNSSTIVGTITRGAAKGTDPYATVTLPSATTQTMPSLSTGNENITLNPGIYTTAWNFWGSQKVKLKPGVYFVKSGIGISTGVTVTGTEVTIVLDGNYTININGSSSLNITAPTSGPTAGIAIYAKQTTGIQQFTNTVTLSITGALYYPNGGVELNSNAMNSASQCTQLIAKTLYLTNNAVLTLRGACTGAGTSSLGASGPSALAE